MSVMRKIEFPIWIIIHIDNAMTTFAKLIKELKCTKVFPSTSPQYKEIQVCNARTAKGVKPDGTTEDIPGRYWPISRANHTIVAQWNRSEFYASRYAIAEPIRHWIISAGNQCFLMEQSTSTPEILHMCAIDINGSTPTFRGGASIDIREQYPVKTGGWTYISEYFMALFIRAITITTKMYLNGQSGIDYPKFYNLHGVSATEETFLRFIDVEFGLNAVMCNLIADWLDGAMAGFIMTSQVVTLEKEDIVIEQMPRATNVFFSDNTIVLRDIAAIKHKHAKAQLITELKPARDATNALLRELLEKKLAGSILAPYLQNISILKDTDTDFDLESVKKELAEFNSREDVAVTTEDHPIMSPPAKDQLITSLSENIVDNANEVNNADNTDSDDVSELMQLHTDVDHLTEILGIIYAKILTVEKANNRAMKYPWKINDTMSEMQTISEVVQEIKDLWAPME